VTDSQRLVRVDQPAPWPGTDARPAGLDRVVLVTLDRPDALNALSFQLLRELADTLERLDGDPGVGCAVITGAGERAFAAGVDIKELATQTPASLDASGAFLAWDRIDRVGLPIVAAVRGYALGGGCELAMACDVIVAGEDARFGQPELALGVIPGAGGTQRLPRRVGVGRAMEIVLTGRRVPAEEAARIGLVDRLVPSERTLAAALELAAGIAAGPPLAVRAAKRAVRAAADLPLSAGLTDERASFFSLFDTPEQREGMAAFIEKRPPRWAVDD
jgi:enoyl-CoA hydratase